MGIYYSTIDEKPRLALENYERALKLVPDDSLVWINVGVVHNMAGEKKEAVEAFNRVIALNNDPGCVKQAQAELAKLRVEMTRYQPANRWMMSSTPIRGAVNQNLQSLARIRFGLLRLANPRRHVSMIIQVAYEFASLPDSGLDN